MHASVAGVMVSIAAFQAVELRGHGVVVSELGSSASLEGGAGSIPAGGSFSLFENCLS